MTTGRITLVSKTNIQDIAVPSSYCDLLSSVSALHPSSKPLTLKFKTQEGQMKPMTSEQDLQEALQSDSINFLVSSDDEVMSFPSTPDALSEDESSEDPPAASAQTANSRIEPQEVRGPCHAGVTCDGCGTEPICGTRYKCVTCTNFDFCEGCWKLNKHPHAFYCVAEPSQFARAEIISLETATFRKAYQEAQGLFTKPLKLKLTYDSDGQLPEGHTVFRGNQVYKSWIVRNSGTTAWPTGCILTIVSGDLKVDTGAIPPLAAKETREVGIHFQVPSTLGLHSYAFRALAPDGRFFGEKLHMTIQVEAIH